MTESATQTPLHRYRAFGLEIASQVPCPEFLPGEGVAQVEIHAGAVPRFLATPWTEDQRTEFDGLRLLLHVEDVARYLVEDGWKITVEPEPTAHPDLVRLFLLGSIFGALLQQRGCMTLHGSAILGRQGACLITGESGAGKSTLAACLAARGIGILSDDVCALTFAPEGPPLLHAAYPRLHLRPDAVDALAPEADRLHATRKAVEKDALELRESFHREPQALRTVIWLECSEEPTLQWEALTGMARFTALAQNTYRTWYLEPMGRVGEHFHQAATVAQHARVFRIRRPPGLEGLEALADLVQHLESGDVP